MSNANCKYTLTDGVLKLENSIFSKEFPDIVSATAEAVAPKSRALPYYEVKALRANGSKVSYRMWDGLPMVRVGDDSENGELNG